MAIPPDGEEAAPRPSLWFLLVLMMAWNAHAAYRLAGPLKVGHESFIGRQIGRTARAHLALGLGVTRGANVSTIRQDGALVVHRSYAPLASWTAAVPMALGVDFDLSVRLPVLVSSNLFLVGLWSFVQARWGRRQADLAALFAALSPVLLFRYGLTSIFEILAMGPMMAAVALYARPRRDPGRCALIAAFACASVMYSWICWLVIVPLMVRDWRAGHRRAAVAVGSAAVALPVAVHFLTMGLATGALLEDIRYFFVHISHRSSAELGPGRPSVTYPQILGVLVKRWVQGIGVVPLAWVILVGVAVAARRRVPGVGWIAALFVMALPLNLARNIAFIHDFFIILFVPAAATCAGVGTWWLATRFEFGPRRAGAVALVLAAFVAFDVAPRARSGAVGPRDREQAAIAAAVGRSIREGDFVIVNGEVCGIPAPVVPWMSDLQRQQEPAPYYCGQMSQAVFVAKDAEDAERLARWARPGQRVVLLEIGDARFDPPASYAPIPTGQGRLTIGVRRPEVAGRPAESRIR